MTQEIGQYRRRRFKGIRTGPWNPWHRNQYQTHCDPSLGSWMDIVVHEGMREWPSPALPPDTFPLSSMSSHPGIITNPSHQDLLTCCSHGLMFPLPVSHLLRKYFPRLSPKSTSTGYYHHSPQPVTFPLQHSAHLKSLPTLFINVTLIPHIVPIP